MWPLNESTKKCYSSHLHYMDIPGYEKFCSNCGAKYSRVVLNKCRDCDGAIYPSDKHCERCGTKV